MLEIECSAPKTNGWLTLPVYFAVAAAGQIEVD
jgi:hypothetical protein